MINVHVHSRAMKLQQLYSAHEGATTSLSFHPSGNFLASGAGDSKVSLEMLILIMISILVILDLLFHLLSKLLKGVWFE